MSGHICINCPISAVCITNGYKWFGARCSMCGEVVMLVAQDKPLYTWKGNVWARVRPNCIANVTARTRESPAVCRECWYHNEAFLNRLPTYITTVELRSYKGVSAYQTKVPAVRSGRTVPG